MAYKCKVYRLKWQNYRKYGASNNRFKVKHIAAHDTERYNIRKDFEASFQFIDDARAAGSKILVSYLLS